MQHHEQGVRGLALRHQQLPAHQILADHGANAFRRCSELSVLNSAKSSDTFPHANVELGPSIGHTRFCLADQCTAGPASGRAI